MKDESVAIHLEESLNHPFVFILSLMSVLVARLVRTFIELVAGAGVEPAGSGV